MKSLKSRALVAWLVFGVASPVLAAGHAHVHGVAKLDVAVDNGSISFQLDSPLDNLVGFEHAPRTAAERKLAGDAVARLRQAATIFKIDPAAQCVPAKVELASSALALGTVAPEEAGHADIDGSYEFSCKNAAAATYVDVGLFAFERLQRLEVQVAAPGGQFKRDLKRPAARIDLRP